MANYCPNCGTTVDSDASFCKNCGTALNNNSYNNQSKYSTTNTTSDILGTLVAVSLVGGLTRQLYYFNGHYFLDPHCRRPFVGPRIIGPHRPIGMRPHPMGMHHGGFHRGPGGPRGGGFGGMRGGPRGGGHR